MNGQMGMVRRNVVNLVENCGRRVTEGGEDLLALEHLLESIEGPATAIPEIYPPKPTSNSVIGDLEALDDRLGVMVKKIQLIKIRFESAIGLKDGDQPVKMSR